MVLLMKQKLEMMQKSCRCEGDDNMDTKVVVVVVVIVVLVVV